MGKEVDDAGFMALQKALMQHRHAGDVI